MSKGKLNNIFLVISIFIVCLFLFSSLTHQVKAGEDHNIRGKAKVSGSSLEFNGGADYVDIGKSIIPANSDFTFSSWVNIPSSPNKSHGALWSQHATGMFYAYTTYGSANGNIRFNSIGGTTEVLVGSDIRGSGWTHVLLLRDGNNFRLYVNGDLDATGSSSGTVNQGDFFIGKEHSTNTRAFNGLIDDVRIYDIALSADDVHRLYSGREVGVDNLVGHWRFNEGQDSIAHDSSGNENDGTIHGASWSSDTKGFYDNYVYFNCLDEEGGTFPYNFSFILGGDPCDVEYIGIDEEKVEAYGVSLDFSDYTFYGYAKHERDGLISFRNGTPDNDYSFLSNCPNTDAVDCNESNNCSACYNEASDKVYGYAYILSTGDWIKLDHEKIEATYRFSIYNYEASSPGDFYGYTYYNNWGKVDLNCINTNSCHVDDFKVHIWHLELAEMSAPNWNYEQVCSDNRALKAVLRWDIRGGLIDNYKLRINNQNNFDTATEFTFTGSVANDRQVECYSGSPLCNYNFNYSTPYYWWLKLNSKAEYEVVAFTDVGSHTWTVPEGVTSVDVLVVAGGGSGASTMSEHKGGGGGAGGLVFVSNYEVDPNSNINIIVGDGGAAIPDSQSTGNRLPGLNGENSMFDSLEAIGGGGGRRSNSSAFSGDGGSGGGGHYSRAGGAALQEASVSGGFGNSGGSIDGGSSAGFGGGGAGSSGGGGTGTADGSQYGGRWAGGDGLNEVVVNGVTYNFAHLFGLNYGEQIGNQIWFAGGGGGGINGTGNTSYGAGGRGGGGRGAWLNQGDSSGPWGSTSAKGEDALVNTGGGGGGAGGGESGAGGSGIVLIRYQVSGETTGWTQFNHDEEHVGVSGILTDNVFYNSENSDDKFLTFTTYQHEFPRANFSWEGFPNADILAGTSTNFFVNTEGETYYYTEDFPSSNPKVFDDGLFIENFKWTGLPADQIFIENNTASSTDIYFHSIGEGQRVYLRVEDETGYYCRFPSTYEFDVNYQLPLWREVKAE